MAVKIRGSSNPDVEVYLEQSGDIVYLRESKTGYAIVSIGNYGGKLSLTRLGGFDFNNDKDKFDYDSEGKIRVY